MKCGDVACDWSLPGLHGVTRCQSEIEAKITRQSWPRYFWSSVSLDEHLSLSSLLMSSY